MLPSHVALRKDIARRDKPVTLQSREIATVAGMIYRILDPDVQRICALHFASEIAATRMDFDTARFLAACDVTPVKP